MANLRANRITSTEVFETTGSVQFDGSGDRLVTTLSSSPSNSAFTIESWVYFSGSTSSGNYTIFDFANATGGYGIFVKIDDGTANFRYYSDNSGTAIGSGVSVSFTSYLNTWVHIATTFDGSTYRAFFDGDLIGSFSASTEVVALNRLTIGARSDSAVTQPWLGHISNLRYIAGTALYTENFTPPTRELEVIPNTVLLACQSTTKADEEKTGKTITVNGNAVANELTPGLLTNVVKSGGSSAITGSVEFDGTGDYLEVDLSTDAIGTDEFTIEMWVNPGETSFTNNRRLIRIGPNNNANNLQILYNAEKSNFEVDNGTNELINPGITTVATQSWSHVALTRQGTDNLKLFVNGVEDTATTTSADISQTTVQIGDDSTVSSVGLTGFISNLRIIKGTALYTSNFIPPTRKLTKLPGTVLLCCQDPDNPLTEATGKTITGYGDLVQVGISTNLADSGSYTDGSTGSGVATFVNNVGIITGTDSSNRGILYKTVSVIQGNKYEFSFRSTDASTNGKAGVDSNDGTNDVLDDVTNTPDLVYFSGSTVPNLDTTTGLFRQTFTATTNEAVLYFQEIGAGTLQVTDITLTAIDGRKGSDFTPSVGSDDSVEFAGPTTINTENYFYLPTGTTEQRDVINNNYGARGLNGGGLNPSTNSDVIDYVTSATLGDAIDFGNLTEPRRTVSSVSSSTRGLWGSGLAPAFVTTIDFVTITSTGNAQDFGDVSVARYGLSGCSNSTRGLFIAGEGPAGSVNTIDYITLSTSGTAQDFGDTTITSRYRGSFASPTRGVMGGGSNPTFYNTIDYVTIASTGNAQDFGDLTSATSAAGPCSNSTRGVWGGGSNPNVNTIDFVTISSMSNAIDFGDLTEARHLASSYSSSTRGVFAGGYIPSSPSRVKTIDYISIPTTGNAIDFGEATIFRHSAAGCSNGHGGLG
jgi:hypothetical protein